MIAFSFSCDFVRMFRRCYMYLLCQNTYNYGVKFCCKALFVVIASLFSSSNTHTLTCVLSFVSKKRVMFYALQASYASDNLYKYTTLETKKERVPSYRPCRMHNERGNKLVILLNEPFIFLSSFHLSSNMKFCRQQSCEWVSVCVVPVVR